MPDLRIGITNWHKVKEGDHVIYRQPGQPDEEVIIASPKHLDMSGVNPATLVLSLSGDIMEARVDWLFKNDPAGAD